MNRRDDIHKRLEALKRAPLAPDDASAREELRRRFRRRKEATPVQTPALAPIVFHRDLPQRSAATRAAAQDAGPQIVIEEALAGTGALHESGVLRPEELLFFDLETTGLSSSPLFLIGTMTWEGPGLVIRQYFARDYSQERAVVSLFL
jgi:uncharacterized protein YprB with RNaseH-like and TPR domain